MLGTSDQSSIADWARPELIFQAFNRVWKHARITARCKVRFFDACIGSQLLYCLHTAWLNKAFLRKLDGLSSPMFAQNPWTQPRVQRGGFETGCGQGLLRFLLWTSCGFVFSSCVFWKVRMFVSAMRSRNAAPKTSMDLPGIAAIKTRDAYKGTSIPARKSSVYAYWTFGADIYS